MLSIEAGVTLALCQATQLTEFGQGKARLKTAADLTSIYLFFGKRLMVSLFFARHLVEMNHRVQTEGI